MALKYRFEIFTVLFILLLIGCQNIPRDNPLDPKNPESYASLNILIEAFVNTANPYRYNEHVLRALDSIYTSYPNRIAIAEYHRNTQYYSDTYHRTENETLYNLYLEDFETAVKGLPDVFINGTSYRIQGASSIESARLRLEDIISAEIIKNCSFLLELDYTIDNDQIIAEITLAPLHNNSSSDILVKAVLTAQYDTNYHKRVVNNSVKGNLIPNIEAGESKVVTLPGMKINASEKTHLIVFITSEDEKTIYQCQSVEIEFEGEP